MVVGVVALCGDARPAAADPAGPTDHRTEVLEIDPPTASIDVQVIGGDSFVQLAVMPGTTAEVAGYQGEAYLAFHADGTVWVNERAPTHHANTRRDGSGEVPAWASADGEPDWQEVADQGRWAWHDHRAHWMGGPLAAGVEPGDRILEGRIPMRVDGREVHVVVVGALEPPPSPWWWVLGGGLAAAGVAATLALRRRAPWAVPLLVSGAALAAGAVAFRSVPAETGPERSLVVLPSMALVAALAAALLARARSAWATVVAPGLLVLAGTELAAWGWTRRAAVRAAIIPSDLPHPLDRATIVVAIVVGATIAATSLVTLFRPLPTRPLPAG